MKRIVIAAVALLLICSAAGWILGTGRTRDHHDDQPSQAMTAAQTGLQLAWDQMPAGDQLALCQTYATAHDWSVNQLTSRRITRFDAEYFLNRVC